MIESDSWTGKIPFWYLFKPINYVKGRLVCQQVGVIWGWRNCLKYLKRGCNRIEGREAKIWKRLGKEDGSRGGCLKNRMVGTPLRAIIIYIFDSAWCLVTAHIQFSLIKKIKTGLPEHSRTPQPPTSDNISFFPAPPPPPLHQSGRHCVSPLII